MNSQQSKNIIKDISRKSNITVDQTEEIIKSEFFSLRTAIESYDMDKEIYPTVRLPKFGLFFIKPSKKKDYGR